MQKDQQFKGFNKNWYKEMTENQFLQQAYKHESIKDCIPAKKEYNGSVLASSSSKLIASIINPMDFDYYSIDSDLMVRVWCLSTGVCKRSYILETRDQQLAEQNQGFETNQNNTSQPKKKGELARTDNNFKFLVVAFEEGEIQVNDLYSG